MPYTLVKFLVWALLLAAIGGVIGWLLRSLTVRAEMARLRAAGGDPHDLERLRARSAELDGVAAERDRLRMEIADVRGSSAGTLGFASTVDPDALAAVAAPAAGRDADPAEGESGTHESGTHESGTHESGTHESGQADADRTADESDADDPGGGDSPAGGDPAAEPDGHDAEPGGGLATLIPAHQPDDVDAPPVSEGEATAEASSAAVVDVDAARAILGRAIKMDDLTVVEGIGPKIAELCAAIGIESWRLLADTDVSTLRSMLDDAGARFKMHKPQSWPEQASLLADGRWEEFAALTERLDGGV